jgi:uncharacterized membrane protein
MQEFLFTICLVFLVGCFEKKPANVGGTTVPLTLLDKTNELSFDYTGLLDKAQRKDADALQQLLLFSKKLEDPASAALHGAVLREILAKTGDSFFAETIAQLSDTDKNTAWPALEAGSSGSIKQIAPLTWKALLPANGLKEYQGLFVFQSNMNTYRDCGLPEATYLAVDQTGDLEKNYRRLLPHHYPGQAIYAEVKGYKTDNYGLLTLPSNFAGFFVITEILDLEEKNYRNTCIPYEYWALGTEPFWAAQISSKENLIEFKEADKDGTRMFVFANAIEEDSATVYAAINQSTGDNIRIKVKKEACSDGMSDRQYSHSVELTMNGKNFSGCAIPYEERNENPAGEGQ